LKYIFLFLPFCVVSFFLSFDDLPKTTEVTITIPQLKSVEIENHLKNEMNKNKNIDYMNSSLMTNSIVLRVNEKQFSKKKINKILHKWGCQASDFYYRKLNIKDIN
tara:strand:+ start:114 stop:431 length:318 start_codon:yes stop_codon:yes gene_type:complete